MATTASPRVSPGSRRSPPKSTPSPPPASSIARGATARSAASPRASSSLNGPAHRMSLKTAIPPHVVNGETHESLSASLKQETDQKEQLLVQVQNKEQTIASLTTENDNLSSALNAAEIRLSELYADQGRNEEEMAARIEVTDKLRAQVRELEKEKRDIQRRYNEQTATFDAERQASYDNEQHLKSRIQSLTQIRQQPEVSSPVVEYESEAEPEDEGVQYPSREPPPQDITDPETEPAEMTSLKLELSTLSTSYASIQSTLVLLQSQLVDLKRVNHELQEENESYMILLREKTLTGQFDVMRQVGGRGSSEEGDDESNESDGGDGEADHGSLRSIGRSTLDRVEEMPEDTPALEFKRSLESLEVPSSTRSSRHPARHPRKHGTSISYSSGESPPRGESLADLPITGPGLDLAAELGRAENKDIFDGNAMEDRDRSVLNGKGKKVKKEGRKTSSSEPRHEPGSPSGDIDALRTEVKSLKDANKALSLYASKIIDRIISQEGFEHVLAVDYDKESTSEKKAASPKPHRSRPQSLFVGRAASNPNPPTDSPRFGTPPPTAKPISTGPTKKANRRSLSFDWKSFSMFAGDKKSENPTLRPLTLQPGNSPLTSARKLETQEDDEDRRERERLNATMKLMGIQPRESTHSTMRKSYSSPAESQTLSNRRFSLYGARPATEHSDTSSTSARSFDTPSGLTQEALEQVEAENSLAALDAHERILSQEIAQGTSGRFTEMSPRIGSLGRRSRRSIGSGSIVWSAGSKSGDE